jgi:hypothetical protein
MLDLALLTLLAAEPAAADCPWKEPKQPPKLEATVFGNVEFTISSDPNWFRCAKKAGGKLALTFSVGEAGNLTPMEPKPLTSYSERTGVGDALCEKPGLKQVQATLKGTGPMEKLDWSSEIVEIYCEKCQWAGDDNMLVLHTKALTPAGTWTLEATFDPGWYACAKKTGGALELRLFTGETAADVKKMTAPTHVVKGLDGTHVKKTFPLTDPCKGKPKYVGYELGGTGEFQVLPAKGRAIQESQCP